MGQFFNCPHCKYRWESRVPKPLCCPRCKQHLDRISKKKAKAMQEAEAQAQSIDPVDRLLCGSGISVEGAKAEGGPVMGFGKQEPIIAKQDLIEAYSNMSDDALQTMRKPARELKTDLATQELIRRRVAKGEGSRAIADALGIAKSSVNNYR